MLRRTIIASLAFAVSAFILLPTMALAQEGDREEGLLLRVGGQTVIESDEHISLVVIVDGDLEVAGEIANFAAIVDGTAEITNGGWVEGDTLVLNGTLTLRDGSLVSGDILLSDDAELIVESGAEHHGDVQEEAFSWSPGAAFALNATTLYLTSWIVVTGIVLLTALVFAGVGGRQLARVALDTTERVAGTVITTVVLWIILGGASLFLVFTFLGIPLIPPLIIAAGIIWQLGFIVAGTRLGALLLRRPLVDSEYERPYAAALLGTLVLQITSFAAGGGGLFLIMLAILTDDIGWLGYLIGIPAFLLGSLVWIAGMFGAGALVYRAGLVWTRRDRQIGSHEHPA